MKKISAIICCFLCIALLSFPTFALTVPCNVTETHIVNSGLLGSSDNGFSSLFSPLTSVYGNPIYWAGFGDSPQLYMKFTYSADNVSYWILPRYYVSTSITEGGISTGVSYYPDGTFEGLYDFEILGTRDLSPYTTSSGLTIYVSFTYYSFKYPFPSSPSFILYSNSNDVVPLYFPIYAPKAYSSSDASAAWDSLNERIDTVNTVLTAIGNKIDNVNSTVDRVLDEVAKQREFLEKPTPDAVSQGEHIDSELSRVQDDVSGALAAMSIPSVNFEPSNFVLPDDSNVTKNFLNWFSNLYPLNIILPAGVGLWAVYLIIHGVRSS